MGSPTTCRNWHSSPGSSAPHRQSDWAACTPATGRSKATRSPVRRAAQTNRPDSFSRSAKGCPSRGGPFSLAGFIGRQPNNLPAFRTKLYFNSHDDHATVACPVIWQTEARMTARHSDATGSLRCNAALPALRQRLQGSLSMKSRLLLAARITLLTAATPIFAQQVVAPEEIEPSQLKIISDHEARTSLGNVTASFGTAGEAAPLRTLATGSGLPLWTYSVTAAQNSTKYSGMIVGSSPSSNTTTTVPVVLIPVVYKITQGGKTYT